MDQLIINRSYAHYLFGTKNQKLLITPPLQKRLWSYMGGVCKRMGVPVHAIGGGEDHVHMLLTLAPHMSVSMTMKNVKSISSKWMNDTFHPDSRSFRWQRGYLAHSISHSELKKYKIYIRNQDKVHQKTTFDTEYERLKNVIRDALHEHKSAFSLPESA